MIGRDVLALLTGDPLSPALRAFQLGRLEEARALIAAHARAFGVTTTAEFYLRAIARRLTPLPPAAPLLVWRDGSAACGQADWIRGMVGGLVGGEVAEAALTAPARLIVVDRGLSPEKQIWYRAAYLAGHEITLIHLGNEALDEDCAAYRWCRLVLRTHWSPLLAGETAVHFLPRGLPDAFAHPGEPRPATARPHLWGFAGSPDRPGRPDMLTAMETLGPGALHLTGEEQPALSAPAYRAFLDDCVVAPCPAGAEALDTARVYEALEAGCIPIVERRPGFDYFREALGPHPIPTVTAWAEAPALIRDLRESERLETRRAQCHAWWRHYKANLAARLAALTR